MSTTDGGELWRKSATELARLVAAREVKAAEVVDAHLRRIDEVNAELNAVVVVLTEEAREAAAAADEALPRGERLGRLQGVPITVKENVDVAGSATTHGLPVFAAAVPDADSPIVERLRAQSGVLVGRSNMPDLGLRMHTDSSLRGATTNPWDPSLTPAGSSGGEAVAIATGMSAMGIGNDIGGSLRNPASACGIASIKPTVGVVPWVKAHPPLDDPLSSQLMAVCGVMARSVEDVRLGLSVIAGQHPGDPGSLPVPLVERPRDDAPVIALLPEPPGGDTDPRIAELVRAAGLVLEGAGYRVEEAAPPAYEEIADLWGRWLLSDVRPQRGDLEAVMGPDALRFLDLIDPLFLPFAGDEFFAAMVRRRTIARLWAAFFSRYAAVVSPVWTQLPFAVGFDIAGPWEAASTLSMAHPVLPANLLGLPAAVVPGGSVGAQPVGLQVVGASFDDLVCLRIAQAIEDDAGPMLPIDPVPMSRSASG